MLLKGFVQNSGKYVWANTRYEQLRGEILYSQKETNMEIHLLISVLPLSRRILEQLKEKKKPRKFKETLKYYSELFRLTGSSYFEV